MFECLKQNKTISVLEKQRDHYHRLFTGISNQHEELRKIYWELKEKHDDCVKDKVKEHYRDAFEDRINIRLAQLTNKLDDLIEYLRKK